MRFGGNKLLVAGCGAKDSATEDDTTWVGTITTEGNITTVVNESGSVWGGTATLVEELSIGVELGAEEYMFGQVIGLYADDKAIYVVDQQVPAVRAYDHDGHYLRDFGATGQGPGEYTRPVNVGMMPDGDVLVLDNGTGRINVYAPDGEVRNEIYSLEAGVECCPVPWFVGADETIWIGHREWDPRGSVYGATSALRSYDLQGTGEATRLVPKVDYDRAMVTGPDGRPHVLPYSPTLAWSVAPSGSVIVGASDRYRFEIHSLAGAVTRVERMAEFPPLSDEEKDWLRRIQIAVGRAPQGWDGAELPKFMPAFMGFVPAQSGEIWVNRFGPSNAVPGCAEVSGETRDELMGRGPCWERTRAMDVFGPDGRFLGPVDLPRELRELNQLARPWISGDRFIMAVADEAGTIMVKRYRLVLPGEAGR